MQDRQEYRPDIDGLRAVAIVPVLLYHANGLVPGGFIGVDVFFVISGYLITKILDGDLTRGRFSILRFYARRVRRILPALCVLFAILSVVADLCNPPLQYIRFSDDLSSAAAMISNIHFYRQTSYFDTSAVYKPLLHTWSLGIEEQFYLVWPVLLWLLSSSRLPRWRAAILLGLCLASLALSEIWVETQPNAAFYLLPARAWELALGALLALGEVRRVLTRLRPLQADILSLAGLTSLGTGFIFFTSATPFPGLAALAPCLGTAAIIAAGESGRPIANRLLALPPLVFIGRISFSLYLWHWPILVFGRLLLERPLTPFESWSALLAAFLIAILSWKFIEQPFLAWKPRFNGSSVWIAGGVSAAALFIGFGIAGAADRGFSFRAPELYRQSMEMKREADDFQASACMSRDARLPPLDGCLSGAAPRGTAYTAAFWGDSYAAHLAPILADVGQHLDLTFREITKAGCPPLIGMIYFPPDPLRAECRAFNDAALHALAENQHLRLIVLSSRWDALVSGGLLVTTGDPTLSPLQSRQNVIAALRAAFDLLSKTDRQIVLLGQIPVPDRDVVACLERVRFIHASDARCASMPAKSARAIDAEVTELLRAAATPYPNVIVVPVTDAFCGEAACALMRDGKPLYQDETHLSHFAASLLAPIIEQKLRTKFGPHSLANE